MPARAGGYGFLAVFAGLALAAIVSVGRRTRGDEAVLDERKRALEGAS